MEMVSNAAAVKQISEMLLCSSMNIDGILNTLMVGLTLAYTPETHSHLIRAGMIQGLLKVHTVTRRGVNEEDMKQIK